MAQIGCGKKYPFDWEMLRRIICEDRITELGREPSWEARYQEFRKGVAAEWKSMGDQVKVKYLSYPVLTDPATGLKYAGPRPNPDELVVRFAPNDYPYWAIGSVTHNVLWATRMLSDKEVEAILESALGCPGSSLTSGDIAHEKKVMWFRNPIITQSIPEIWHIQVFHNKD